MTRKKQPPYYETIFFTVPHIEETELGKIKERVSQMIQDHEGKVLRLQDWGKKRLAYPIGKETRGRYTYMLYTAKGNVVASLEQFFRVTEKVIRFLTVRLTEEQAQQELAPRKKTYTPSR